METIKILKIVSKETRAGKPYKMCEVECEGEIRKVNIWSNAPDFANLKEGSVIMGKMTLDGQYWNISYDGQEKRSGGASGAFKQAQIKEVMDVKRQDIQKSQENRENSIKIASTIRMAVDLTIAMSPEQRETTIEETIRKWREWLWEEWDEPSKNPLYPN